MMFVDIDLKAGILFWYEISSPFDFDVNLYVKKAVKKDETKGETIAIIWIVVICVDLS
jgi:hypothetical protein